MSVRIMRSEHNPIIRPEMDERIEGNINGPTLIRVPEWIEKPLGRYYLYFAHHQGKFIRMAYADDLWGPYTVHTPGVLEMRATSFERHIASPDVHVDNNEQVIRMFYHGSGFTGDLPEGLKQITVCAESNDGLNFATDQVCLGISYMRIFEWDGWYYGFGGGGTRHLWRTKNYRELFECGPHLDVETEDYTNMTDADSRLATIYRMRHPALHLQGQKLDIYYSNVGDTPERIKRTIVDLRGAWTEWKGSPPEEILRTEYEYEGLDLPNEPSVGGSSHIREHQVRDPYLFVEDGHKYLVYSVAGETGLGIAELIEE